MRKQAARGLAALALVLAGRGAVSANTILDTTPSWDGSTYISSFGVASTTTYGETFIAPSDNVLQDYSFQISGDAGVHLSMKGYVFAWSGGLLGGEGGQAVGPALYGSPSSILFDGNGNFQTVTVTTGGTALTPGNAYVMLLTISNPSDLSASTGTAVWGDAGYQHVAGAGGGGFVFFNNGNNFGALNTQQWDNFSDFGDLAFTAHFTSAPEPASLGLLSVGAIVLMGFAWRRRRTWAMRLA